MTEEDFQLRLFIVPTHYRRIDTRYGVEPTNTNKNYTASFLSAVSEGVFSREDAEELVRSWTKSVGDPLVKYEIVENYR